MYTGFLHLHSSLRYLVLIFLLLAIVFALTSKTYEKKNKMTALFALIFSHIQFLLGWVMYFMSGISSYWGIEGFMKDKFLRFWALEHPITMTLGIILITAGYSISKRKTADNEKLKPIYIFYTLGLILILASIPWPFREVIGRGWFATAAM
jgi:heme A synthase